MDFSGVAQLGAKALVVGPAASQPQPAQVPRVEPKSETSGAGNQSGTYSRQDDQADASRDILALRQAVAQGRRAAGPPPSFEVSLLEVEGDLQQKLARMEAARSKERDAEALQTAAEAETLAMTKAVEEAQEAAKDAASAQASDEFAAPLTDPVTDPTPSTAPETTDRAGPDT